MLRFAALFALVAVAAAEMNEGYTCIRCNQARDTEEKCNNQKGDPGTVDCGPNDVCTTDVRCDGRGRPYYIKGCQPRSSITALDELICNADVGSATRCHWHCEGDLCNEAMPQVAEGLACTDNPPTACTAGFSRQFNGPGPDMNSFACENYNLNSQNKFLMAQAYQTENNPCKFQVRCQLDEDRQGEIFLWWCGVAYGIHSKNPNKFSKNFRISQSDMELEARGQNFGEPQVTNGMQFTIPPGSLFEGTNHMDGTYTITGSYPPENCEIEVKYADGDPDDKMTLTVKGYDIANMNGACADTCFGYDPDTQMDECIDGKHQNPA